MSNMDPALVQYQVFAQRRLHFARMFWMNIAFILIVLLALGFFVAFAADRDNNLQFEWLFLGAGVATLQMSYIVHRLKRLEDQYEQLMHDIEIGLRETGQALVIIAPRSGRLSARTMAVLSLTALGLVFIIAGVTRVVT